MKTILFLFLFVVGTVSVPTTQAEAAKPPEQVSRLIWRSARPTFGDLQKLKAAGVKVVINLEDNRIAVARDAEMARKLGLKFLSYPMSPIKTPNESMVRELLKYLRNPEAMTLVHCKLGEDRTGLIIGLHRRFNEGWSARQAYEEMLIKGYHPIYWPMTSYYIRKSRILSGY